MMFVRADLPEPLTAMMPTSWDGPMRDGARDHEPAGSVVHCHIRLTRCIRESRSDILIATAAGAIA